MKKYRLCTLLISLILLGIGGIPVVALEVPPLRGRVNDYANILSPEGSRELEAYLAAVEQSSGAQLALLSIASLEGEDLEGYSIKVAETWALGSRDEDNGALLLVAMDDRKIRIEVGYGLEGVITDAKSGFIIREILLPQFRTGNFEEGITAAMKTMGGLSTGDANIDQKALQRSQSQQKSRSSGSPVGLIIFLILMLLGGLGRRRRFGGMGSALFLGAMLGGRGHRGGTSSGGFGGGGFSGGGGGFGGGGASGGW